MKRSEKFWLIVGLIVFTIGQIDFWYLTDDIMCVRRPFILFFLNVIEGISILVFVAAMFPILNALIKNFNTWLDDDTRRNKKRIR